MGIRLQLVKYPGDSKYFAWVRSKIKNTYIYIVQFMGILLTSISKSLWMIKLSIINYIIHLLLQQIFTEQLIKLGYMLGPGTASSNETDIAQILHDLQSSKWKR